MIPCIHFLISFYLQINKRLVKNISFLFFFCLLFAFSPAYSQQKDQTSLLAADTITNFSAYKRKLSFAGVLQTRFVGSITKNADVNGKNFDPEKTKGINNAFFLKRVRVMVKADINDHFSANILANLAEFNSDPSNKVLENAYIKYSLNKYFHVQAGQFRPFFGIEDAMAVDIIRTLDFSNQYYAFGKNGWQSFQIGVSVLGDINKKGNLRYFAGIYNGNNKNQPGDDNNTKNMYARVESDIAKDFTVGVNAGGGSLAKSGLGNAWGADVTTKIDLSEKWALLLMAEYKSGTNFLAFNVIPDSLSPELGQYRMQGFYFFPTLRFDCKKRRIRAIEFSTRYEYLDENYKMATNARQTIIPNLSLIFADDFYAALQMGVSIDMYKSDIPLTITNTHNLGYIQLQIRF
jgi:hypothetical protein